MNAKTLLHKAKSTMLYTEISISDYSSDLYLKVTPISKELISGYDSKDQVTTFRDFFDKELWFKVPFGNTDWYERHGVFCGDIEY